ncbi:aminoacyl-tRNA deacylase [Candidatus Nanohalobium constans]|uniref:Cys-tRNA(Pro) deacylase, prolyl-tRNA editing enzyme YbaK/EbsC n=1 Tax=Candidatus Nanohalobium constans TaxID=2565781 RepID=A0A5Q0UEN5_9ARCH|nr:YbaK/EbsC family protein [Candidatus Nanohalobium constans]QGA79996.1 cys-tRNA(Pro) deacylase, prolyl-tRNA editing enzyme YbaK/EbsC [Candidatus Nanohalobium constans]
MSESFRQKPEELEQFIEFFEEDRENILRVKEFCKEKELDVEFKVHPKAETCEESAQHTDIKINQIVKTLIFKTGENLVAVLAPGDERVDTDKIRENTGEENVRMADPEEVKNRTGYVIGGVSPFDLEIPVYMEEELLEHDIVRPAAGSRVIGVEISPEELEETLNAESVKLVD